MNKASTDSITVIDNYNTTFTDVLNISIANYGANSVVLEVNGVRRELPPANTSPNVPTYQFGFHAHGCPFDIQVKILFESGASKVIIDKAALNC